MDLPLGSYHSGKKTLLDMVRFFFRSLYCALGIDQVGRFAIGPICCLPTGPGRSFAQPSPAGSPGDR